MILVSYPNITDRLDNLFIFCNSTRNQIKILQEQGKYDRVNEIIKSRPELNLQQYAFGAESWNALEEETRNLEILAKSKKQQIFYQEEEPDGGECNIWIG